MDGLQNKLRLGLAAIGLLGLGAGVTVVLAPGGGDAPVGAAPAAFELEPLPIDDLGPLADGYGHHLVFLPDQGDAVPDPATDPGEDASAAPAVAGAEDAPHAHAVGVADGHPPTIGIDDLVDLGDHIDSLDGNGDDELWVVLDDGTRIAVVSAREADTAPVDADDAATDPAADAAADDGAAPAGLAELEADPSTRSIEPVGGGWYAVATARDDEDFAAFVESLGLESTPDVPVHVSEPDEHHDLLWGLDNRGDRTFAGVVAELDVDADGVEATAVERGNGVIVAVIDSGSVTDHPDLPDFWVNTDEICDNAIDDDANGYVDDCHGWDFYNGDNTPADDGVDNSHGTHVTGTIAAVPANGTGIAGLAPGVTVMNLKALQNGSTWMSRTAEAIRYAVDNGASVINASWGSSGATLQQVPSLADAVEYARQHGVIVVAASGNSGNDLFFSPTFPASLPHDNVITVGAHLADGRPAPFSNWGDEEVDLHAPGHYIVSTVAGGYSAKQGTSMAAPHVTAAVALVQARDPGAGIQAVRDAVLDTVDRRPTLAGQSATAGTLNAARAIGVEAGLEGAPFDVTVHGLDSLQGDRSGRIDVVTTVRDTGVAGPRPVVVRATVLTQIDGVDYGVVELPVTVDGVPKATDDHAQVILSRPMFATSSSFASGVRNSMTMSLSPGVYALVVELVDAEDPDAAYGPAAVVFTEVPESLPTPVTEPPGDEPASGDEPTAPEEPPAPDQPADPDQPTDPDQPPANEDPPSPDEPATPPTTAAPDDPGAGDDPAVTVPPTTTPTGDPGLGGPPTTLPPVPSVPDDEPSTPTTTPDDTAVTVPPTTAPDEPTDPDQPPTTAPPTTGPPATVPPTTAPPTTVPPAAPPVTIPDTVDPVTRAGMTLLKVSPTWGPLSGRNLVVIHGRNLPERPLVFVGTTPVQVKRANDHSILVEMPPGFPGIYDVTVVDEDGNALTLRLAYTYIGSKPRPGDVVNPGPPGPPPLDDWFPPEDDPNPVDEPVDDPEPPAEDPTTTTAPEGGGEPESTTTTTVAVPEGRPRLILAHLPRVEGYAPPGQPTELTLDEDAELPPGPRLHRVVSGSPVELPPVDWAARSCTRPACGAELHLL